MPVNDTRVFFDITIGDRTGGRVVFQLFNDTTPRTAENFRGLCTGEYGIGQQTRTKLSFAGTRFFKVQPGFMCQSGDFVNNNGSGGESIFGGSFRDENFDRRHTCAGMLSMANNGRHTNTSQFFITLKAAPQLNNKHVIFGQVVAGMDVIRAIEKVPVDHLDRPRVPITIVSCGELGKSILSSTGEDLTQRLSKKDEPDVRFRDRPLEGRASTAGEKLLAGTAEAQVQMDAPVRHPAADAGMVQVPTTFKNEREKKLFELRLKMNQGRRANDQAVLDEKRRYEDPTFEKKRMNSEMKSKDAEKAKEEDEDERLRHAPKGKEYLLQTAESSDMQVSKKAKKGETFGWDVFNGASLYRSHDKNIGMFKHQTDEYQEQLAELGDSTFYSGVGDLAGHVHKPTDAAKERLGELMAKKAAKADKWSRRRMWNDDKDVDYINDRNRVFNEKIHRAFGKNTETIKANLERGTAL